MKTYLVLNGTEETRLFFSSLAAVVQNGKDLK